MVTRGMCRTGRAATSTSCTHKKASVALWITLVWQFRWIALLVPCTRLRLCRRVAARNRSLISVDDGVPSRSRCARADRCTSVIVALSYRSLCTAASGDCPYDRATRRGWAIDCRAVIQLGGLEVERVISLARASVARKRTIGVEHCAWGGRTRAGASVC